MVVLHSRIYRGEIRKAYPTYEHPDPAVHAAEDPAGFLKNWMRPEYPYPEGWRGGAGLSVGQHWTRSPEIIPDRFAVPWETFGENPQPGVPMGKREQTAVSRQERLENHYNERPIAPPYPERPDSNDPEAHEEYSRKLDEHWKASDEWHEALKAHEANYPKLQTYLDRVEREGVNRYHDLSGNPDRPGAARKYNMAIVWEGQKPPSAQAGTNYEDELDIPFGEHVTVTGARLYIPKSGAVHDFRGRHPTWATPEEHAAARFDVHARSTYSAIDTETHVPWSRVQFENAQEIPVARGNYASR